MFALAGIAPYTLFARHIAGDWGTLDAEDVETNEEALEHGGRLMSAFELEIPYPDSPRVLRERVWVITEADRSVCTALLPEEY